MLLGENNDNASSRYQIIILVSVMILLLGLPYLMLSFQDEPPLIPPAGHEQMVDPTDSTADTHPGDAIAVSAGEEASSPLPEPGESEIPAPTADALASAPAEPRADHVVLENGRLRLEFTRVGARLKRAWVLVGKTEDDHPQLVELDMATPDVESLLPLDLNGLNPGGVWPMPDYGMSVLSRVLWDVQASPAEFRVTFTFEAPGVARITKRFTLAPEDYLLDLAVGYSNLSGSPQRLGLDTHVPAYSVTWEPNLRTEDDQVWGAQQSIVWRVDGANDYVDTSKLQPPVQATGYSQRVERPTWLAVRSTYFLVAMRALPGANDDWADRMWGWASGSPAAFRVGIAVPRKEVAAGERVETDFRFYIGPTQLSLLKEAAGHGFPELEEALQFFSSVGFMDAFAKLLLRLMHFFHERVWANWGVAIILLTILVRMAVFPLTLKGMKSMKRMQLLQPEIEKIKEETKENPQEFQKRTMELYKHYGINPIGGCMPLLLQMPVFFALYRMLWSAFELRGAEFLWIEDLSKQDALIEFGFEIPLIFFSIDAFNVLPILMAVAMLVSQRMTPTTVAMQPQQKMIMNIMPVMFSVFLYNYASGLNLYILTSTLLGIGQNMLVRAQHVELTPKEQKTKATAKKRPQHFYHAAQAKKKEMAKEARKAKESRRSKGSGGNTGPKKRS